MEDPVGVQETESEQSVGMLGSVDALETVGDDATEGVREDDLGLESPDVEVESRNEEEEVEFPDDVETGASGADEAGQQQEQQETCGGRGWVWQDGRCYLLVEERAVWAAAETRCQKEHGGHLATVSSPQVSTLLTRLARNR